MNDPARSDPGRGRPLALVTGGSSGIGLALAERFAGEGHDLLLAAEAAEELDGARERIARRFPLTVTETVVADLTRPDEVERLFGAYRALGRPLDVLAANAGIGAAGDFADVELARHLAIVDLNVRSQVHLVKLAVDHMLGQRRGRILLTSSILALAPGPQQTVYAASKAFLHSFGVALAEELKRTPVSLTVLMPGATDTGFWERNEMEDAKITAAAVDQPPGVAAAAFESLMRGDAVCIPGTKNKLIAAAGKIAPSAIAASLLHGSGDRR